MCAAAAVAFNAPVTHVQSSFVARSAAPIRTSMVVMEEVEDKVKSIIAEQLGVELDTVTPDASVTALIRFRLVVRRPCQGFSLLACASGATRT